VIRLTKRGGIRRLRSGEEADRQSCKRADGIEADDAQMAKAGTLFVTDAGYGDCYGARLAGLTVHGARSLMRPGKVMPLRAVAGQTSCRDI